LDGLAHLFGHQPPISILVLAQHASGGLHETSAVGEIPPSPIAGSGVSLLYGGRDLSPGCRVVTIAFLSIGRVDDGERHELGPVCRSVKDTAKGGVRM
jgi:hypothetical protein